MEWFDLNPPVCMDTVKRYLKILRSVETKLTSDNGEYSKRHMERLANMIKGKFKV